MNSEIKLKYEIQKINGLASCDSGMIDFLRKNQISKIFYPTDEKCAIFSIQGLTQGDNLKYVVVSKGKKQPEKLRPEIQKVVLRGLRAQMSLQGLEGVQVLRQPGFYNGIIGLLGPFEYLEGCNLSHIDKKSFPELKDPKVVFKLFEQFDKELQRVHLRDIIHGDIKPGNLVYNSKRLVAIDWSTAMTFDEYSKNTGPLIATFKYYYPLIDRSRDYWALSLSLVNVLGINLNFNDRDVRNDSNDLVEKFVQILKDKFGVKFAEFYRDLANRPQEIEGMIETYREMSKSFRSSSSGDLTEERKGFSAGITWIPSSSGMYSKVF